MDVSLVIRSEKDWSWRWRLVMWKWDVCKGATGLRNISSSNLQGRICGAITNSWVFVYFAAVFLVSRLNVLKRFISLSSFRSFFLDPCQIRGVSVFFVPSTTAFTPGLTSSGSLSILMWMDQQLRSTVEMVIFELYEPSLWTWPVNSEAIFLHKTPAFDDASSYQDL